FVEFADKIQDKTKLFAPTALELDAVKVGFSDSDIFKAENIRIDNGAYVFDVKIKEERIENIRFHLPGKHNLSNALMALSMAKTYGVSNENLKKALQSFKGIERRFSYKIKTDDLVLIDDYAHHPTEINAVYNAVKELYPDKKNLAVFQPHLFSRTKDFMDDFAQSLSQFDEVILLDIYPARDWRKEGINWEVWLKKITSRKKKWLERKNMEKEVSFSVVRFITIMVAEKFGKMLFL